MHIKALKNSSQKVILKKSQNEASDSTRGSAILRNKLIY
jgi:hypothetical protein